MTYRKELAEALNDNERLRQEVDSYDSAVASRDLEIERLRQWVNDLQAGMYINCVYCGHRYGPDSEVPATMADALKAHIEQCPEHPMSALKGQRDDLLALVKEARADWQHQWEVLPNTLADIGEADELDALIKKCDALIAKAEAK